MMGKEVSKAVWGRFVDKCLGKVGKIGKVKIDSWARTGHR